MSEGSEWIAWAHSARTADAAAIERLEEYFAPFLHAVLLSRIGHHLAGKLVKPAFKQALQRLPSLPTDAAFGPAAIAAAREHASAASKTIGSMTERPSADPLVNSALQVLQ